jgi:hypothetical protein
MADLPLSIEEKATPGADARAGETGLLYTCLTNGLLRRSHAVVKRLDVQCLK